MTTPEAIQVALQAITAIMVTILVLTTNESRAMLREFALAIGGVLVAGIVGAVIVILL